MTRAVVSRELNGRLLAVTLAAYLATAAGSTLAFGTTTPVWYSNAIILVPLLVRPARMWPAYLVAAWLLDATVIHFFGAGPPLLLSAVDTFEVAVAATVIRVSGGIAYPIYSTGQIARVVGTCVLVPAASALLAASVIARGQPGLLPQVWRSWYSGGMLGLLIGTLFLLAWTDPALRASRVRWTWTSAAGLAAGVLLSAYLVQNTLNGVLLVLTFPIVFALTWHFGLLGATLGTAGVSIATLWAVMRGDGAIGQLLSGGDIEVRMEGAQIYLGAILLCTLPLAVLRARQRDLTENLKRAGDARTEFLAAMSHEIRTPMTGVLGLVDLLADEPLNQRQQGYVDALRLSGRHLLSIINDILDFSRIESGRLELELVDFTLAELLERVRSLTHPLAVERGIALTEDIGISTTVPWRGDELRLRQVLLNLVSNAIKFTEQGEVTVKVLARPHQGTEGTWLRFEVCDTGIGIAEDKLKLLFSPFTQADQSTARQYGGSGLGLAISKRLVEAMGGSISASSTPGAGSVFAFEVPLAAGERVAQEGASFRAAVRPLRILVAEDVQINREILRAVLAKAGHRITFAVNGREALEQVQATPPFDVVLMDVQMPVMDGVEATKRIRALGGRFAGLPIIGLTANVMARERERYLGAGMDECLPKPIDWDLLTATLARRTGAAAVEMPAAAPAGRPAGALVDEGALNVLRQIADADELKALIAMGMKGCDGSMAAILSADRDSDALCAHAHKLKGASSQLGFAAVARLAASVEEAAMEGAVEPGQLALLSETLAATRRELEERGLL